MIEVLELLKVRLPGGQLRDLIPGQPVDLPDEAARKLLQRASGRARVAGLPWVQVGSIVRWDSPLLGSCRGEVLATYPDGAVLVWHPQTERLVKIPLDWIKAGSHGAP